MIYRIKDKKLERLTGGIGSGLPLGSIISVYSDIVPEGYLLCDGSEFDTDKYPALHMLLGTNTLPDLRGISLTGIDDEHTLGDKTDGALPNIVGALAGASYLYANGETVDVDGVTYTNAFFNTGEADYLLNAGALGGGTKKRFYASRSSPVYQNTDKVTAASVYINYCIKAVSGYEENQENTLFNQIKSYMRDQNELSDCEEIELSRDSANPTIMEYDGFLTPVLIPTNSVTNNSNFYVNGENVSFSSINSTAYTTSFPVKKGDEVYYTTINANLYKGTTHAYWYKKRDYSDR